VEQQLNSYQRRPVEVKACKWEKSLGAISGVMARPKKHKLNPDEFFIMARGKEVILTEECWIITNNDGSHDLIPDGQFQELFEPSNSCGPVKVPQVDPVKEEKVPDVLQEPKKRRGRKPKE